MVSSVLLKPVWFQALVCRGFRRHGFHAGPQRGSSKLWFAEVPGGLLHCDYYVVFCPIVGGAY